MKGKVNADSLKESKNERKVKSNSYLYVRKNNLNTLTGKNKKRNFLLKEEWINKKNITYFILVVVDVVLMIYVARKNAVNYVNLIGENIFVSETKNLLVGRNYITLIVTFFFYIYTCLLNCFFLREKNTRKFLVTTFFGYLILNLILFYVFTRKIY